MMAAWHKDLNSLVAICRQMDGEGTVAARRVFQGALLGLNTEDAKWFQQAIKTIQSGAHL